MSISRYLPAKRYSEAVRARGFLYLSGRVPENPEGDARAQTENVLAQIDAILAAHGADKTRIVDCTIYLRDIADYDAMNSAWDAWVADGHAPARATVEARLAKPQWRVEIKVVACLAE